MQLIFGITLSYYLQRWNVTEYMVAELAPVDRSYVRCIVDGQKVPEFPTFVRMYTALMLAAQIVLMKPKDKDGCEAVTLLTLREADPVGYEACYDEMLGAWSRDYAARDLAKRSRRMSA